MKAFVASTSLCVVFTAISIAPLAYVCSGLVLRRTDGPLEVLQAKLAKVQELKEAARSRRYARGDVTDLIILESAINFDISTLEQARANARNARKKSVWLGGISFGIICAILALSVWMGRFGASQKQLVNSAEVMPWWKREVGLPWELISLAIPITTMVCWAAIGMDYYFFNVVVISALASIVFWVMMETRDSAKGAAWLGEAIVILVLGFTWIGLEETGIIPRISEWKIWGFFLISSFRL